MCNVTPLIICMVVSLLRIHCMMALEISVFANGSHLVDSYYQGQAREPNFTYGSSKRFFEVIWRLPVIDKQSCSQLIAMSELICHDGRFPFPGNSLLWTPG